MPDLPHAPHVPPHAYLITLQPLDSAPIQTMRARLAAHGFTVVLVEGFRGADLSAREFFTLTNFWRARTGKLMTPGELGCTLSHQKALRLASSLGDGQHLILEDDVVVSNAGLRWVSEFSGQVEAGTLLHLGGQEGLERFYRYVRGTPVTTFAGVAQVRPVDLEYLRRTTAYVLHARTAAALSDLMQQGAYVADDFAHAFGHGAVRRVWFRWVVSHPRDQIASTIETERRLLGQTTKRHWSYRSRMNWARLWRHLVSPPSAFLKNQQPSNQLPV